MKIKTQELTGPALDWAVAKIEDVVGDDIDDFCLSVDGEFAYSTNWAQGGPIIERERIDLASPSPIDPTWKAMQWRLRHGQHGETALIAAMRCYVASKLGDEVEIPDELHEGES